MSDNRQKLLRILIKNFSQIFRDMHKDQRFPFGGLILTRQQIMILFFIKEKGDSVFAKEISEFLHVTAGAVTQFIDGLVKNKLVERVENNSDRRSASIRLTAATKKRFDYLKKDSINKITKIFNELNIKELEQFVTLTEKIKATSGRKGKE